MATRRIVAIVNPISGRRDVQPVVREVGRLVESRGGGFEVFETVRAGHASELAARLDPQVDAVLAVGGDGTVCEVINGLLGEESTASSSAGRVVGSDINMEAKRQVDLSGAQTDDPPYEDLRRTGTASGTGTGTDTGTDTDSHTGTGSGTGTGTGIGTGSGGSVTGARRSRTSSSQSQPCPVVVLGTGTENLFARELGMPMTPDLVARTLLQGEPFPVDVGLVNGRRFLVVVGIGFDAECILRMSRTRKGHISYLDYFQPIWQTFWEHRFPALRVEVDGEFIFEGRGLVLIGAIGRYAGGMRILARARYDDGLLDVCVLPCASRFKLVGHACRIFLGRHVERGRVIYRQGRRVQVSSPLEVPIEVDGDVGGLLPVDCTVVRGAARFLRMNLSRRGEVSEKTSVGA